MSADKRLDMYVYYGTVSWQILGIFLATAFLMATIPFAIPCQLVNATTAECGILMFPERAHQFAAINEGIAVFLVILGASFWKRNQDLATVWTQRQFYSNGLSVDVEYPNDIERWICVVESSNRVKRRPDLDPFSKLRGITGEYLALLFIGLALAYTIVLFAYAFYLLL